MGDAAATPAITGMALELPEGAAKPFDAPGLARHLLRTIRTAALATNDPASGHPLATLVTVATAMDGSPLLLLSGLSLHTRNLRADPRASLLLVQGGKGDPLAHPRLTLVGRFEEVAAEAARGRFLARHPKAKLYVELPDFRFFRMAVAGVHLNGGFARAAPLRPIDVILDMKGAEILEVGEAEAIAHMNQDHADAVELYGSKLAKAGPGPWRITGLDPEGLDLMAEERTARVNFPRRVNGPGPLVKMLKELAEAARASA